MHAFNHHLDLATLRELSEHRETPCLSLYLPTHRTGREQRQDPIRLKNLLRQAEDQLGSVRGQQSELLSWIEDLADADFWEHQSDGLAIFSSATLRNHFRAPLRFSEKCHVGDRFIVRPLLPLLHLNRKFHILTLTQDSARLYAATRFSLDEIDLPELAPLVPDDPEKSLQFRAHRSPSQGAGNADEVMFHGHGEAKDNTQAELNNFFRRVDDAVTKALRGQEGPLILACVGYLASLYEAVNSCPLLAGEKVPGSPAGWSEEQLLQAAWERLQPVFHKEQTERIEAYHAAKANGRASHDASDTVLACMQGRVDTLFVATGQELKGAVDFESQTVRLDNEHGDGEEEDLIDYAAAQALAHGGSVLPMDQPPDNTPLAALLRY